MTKIDRLRIAQAANGILFLWKQMIDEAEVKEPDPLKRCWYRHDRRQAFQDSLNAMRFTGLIEDYDVVKIQVKIAGEWTGSMKVIVA